MKKINRRRFLLGASGVTVALPFLPSLLTSSRAEANDDRPRYAVFVRAGNGVQQAWSDEPERFWPRTAGPLTAAVLGSDNADRATSELADYAERLTLVRGIDRIYSTPSCGHSESIPQVLTAAQVTPGTSNDSQALGLSADWRICNQLTPGVEPLTLMAGPQSAYIREALSWRASGTRHPAQRSPARQLEDFMGLERIPPELQEQVRARRISVNDLVRDQVDAIRRNPRLGSHDRRRLDTHFESIRDMEQNILSCDLDPAQADPIMAQGDNVEGNDVRPAIVRMHMDVIAFAFSCGARRAATLQVGEGNDQTQYEIGGTRLPRFHWISHRIESDGADGPAIPNADLLHHQVDRFQLQMFKHLLDRLTEYDSPYGGQLLDDCVACWTNDLASGPPHSGTNLPWILAGGAAGCLRTGQYVDLDSHETSNKMLNTILSAVGCTADDGGPVEDFGDASNDPGRIDALVV